jgi:hypothetical protein
MRVARVPPAGGHRSDSEQQAPLPASRSLRERNKKSPHRSVMGTPIADWHSQR